jgi:aspartyl/glutamyl-tRNA(Asn/Gln) amidotransferase C subunit
MSHTASPNSNKPNSDSITETDLNHVLSLAKLSLSESEKPIYIKHLSQTLSIMTQFQNLKSDTPTPNPGSTDVHLRPDYAQSCKDSLRLAENAPQWDSALPGFVVPPII